MHVLGIDPSLTCTGVARTWESTAITTARFKTDTVAHSTGPEHWTETRERIRYILGNVLRFAPAQCLTIIEEPYVPRDGAGAIVERAWLFGILIDQLMLRGPVIAVDNRNRAKYAADSANASKRVVLDRVRLRFGPAVDIPDHNVADAVALLGMGARWVGSPVDGEPTSKQMEAIRAIHWPDRGERTS